MKIFVTVICCSLLLFSGGYTNYETKITSEKSKTIEMIKTKEKEVLEEAKKYKEVLEQERDTMILLLKELKEVESLMKSNQLKRKRSIHYWKKFLSSQKTIKDKK